MSYDWFRYTQDYIDHEIDNHTADTWFTTNEIWPTLTANTLTKVGNGTSVDLDVFYPSSGGDPSPCKRFFDAFGFPPYTVAEIQAFEVTIADLTADRAAVKGHQLGVWWNILPEHDSVGGRHIPVAGHPFTAGTRAGMYTQYLDYVNDWTPTWAEILQVPQATRGYWTFCVNVWNANCHYSYEWGVDLVMLERATDEIGDPATGIAFVRGAGSQYNKPWGFEVSHFRTSAGANAVTAFDQGTGLNTGGYSTSWTKRHLYLAYMAGANKILSESINFRYGDTSLNPLGVLLDSFGDFTVARPTRGTTWVPFALLMDHDHGFVPRHWVYSDAPLAARGVWYGILGYNAGDHATDALFVHLWPNHWKHGQSMGWDGGSTVVDTDFNAFGAWIAAGNDARPYEPMPTSTYGDIFDVLNSIATAAALTNYRVVMPIGNFAMTAGWRTLMTDYATAGGTVVLNSTQVTSADETLLGVTLGSTTTSTSSKWGSESNLTEGTYTYRIVTLGTATTVATNPANGDPVITVRTLGTGKVYFVTPNYMQKNDNTGVLEITKRFLQDLHETHRKSWVSSGSAVEWVTTKGTNFTTMTIANQGSSTWNGTIKINQHLPSSAREWLTDTAASFSIVSGVATLDVSVPAFDVRIFAVTGDDGEGIAPTPIRPGKHLKHFIGGGHR